MTFKDDMVNDFTSSMTFLIESMLETLKFCFKGKYHVKQTVPYRSDRKIFLFLREGSFF